MTGIPLWRRVTIALVALCVAGAAFRGQVATALVTRGDDALRNGDRSASVRYYQRALAIDARSSAADRLAFGLAMRKLPGDAQAAIEIANTALERRPDSEVALLADRGLAEQHLRRWRAAERDFARAGAAGSDARYDHLAGRIALRLGDRNDARGFFAAALRHDPAFGPARAALARLQ
jgi:tetratricopeptide (TPR) repeat protein